MSTVIIALVALRRTGIPFLGVMGNAAAFCVVICRPDCGDAHPGGAVMAGTKIMSKKLWASIDIPRRLRNAARRMPNAPKPNGWLRLVLARPLRPWWPVRWRCWRLPLPMSQMRLGLPDASNFHPPIAPRTSRTRWSGQVR